MAFRIGLIEPVPDFVKRPRCRWVYLIDMGLSSHTPAGFCPFCEYAMDAGRCPECGRDVPADRLAKSVRLHRLIRRGKRAAKVVTVLAIVGGLAYGVYHETRPHRWVKYCSTDYLLSLIVPPRANVWNELELRLINGDFT